MSRTRHLRLHPAVCLGILTVLVANACGYPEPGTVTATPVPDEWVRARRERQPRKESKQILFGDLHVHTTISLDAFVLSLPMMQGQGAHPLADACDYARFCSDLDFFSINDHAEGILQELWQDTKETIRQCNAVAGDPQDPDLVAYLGWEWTQIGRTPETHFGHKNVIFRETADDRVPTRPIGATTPTIRGAMRGKVPLGVRARMMWNGRSYLPHLFRTQNQQNALIGTPVCPEGVDVRELPLDCIESAETPEVLFEKLDEWGFDSLVIPHGTEWGIYTPPGTTIDKQLDPARADPERQKLIEIFSGHGNSEEYRDWRAAEFDADGKPICPEPRDDYEPCCYRAGEIIRARCPDPESAECERNVLDARAKFLAAGVSGRVTIPDAPAEAWLDCGQCRDCFIPAFAMRPGNAVQRALAIGGFTAGGDEPLRFRFGFIASSDVHSARPGTGYKEVERLEFTEAAGPVRPGLESLVGVGFAQDEPTLERALSLDEGIRRRPRGLPLPPWDWERQSSFFLTGGLVAVHSAGRDRDAIWEALERREVYGTSGPRILLWFDLLNAGAGPAPMGTEHTLREPPRFRAKALGSFEQEPGCPEHSLHALAPDRLQSLCRGECYNPSDHRVRISEIEVVRIALQRAPDEDVGDLIQDPWRRFECPGDPQGCTVEFEDPEFGRDDREFAYYVRALQEPTPAVNAGGLRCKRDEAGRCIEVHPCYGDYRTPRDDDCLAENQERAWSSPIWVKPGAS